MNLIDEFRDEREKLIPKWHRWANTRSLLGLATHRDMAKFFEYRTDTFGILDWTDSDQEVLDRMKLLNGPHGYAVYKILVAQNEKAAISD